MLQISITIQIVGGQSGYQSENASGFPVQKVPRIVDMYHVQCVSHPNSQTLELHGSGPLCHLDLCEFACIVAVGQVQETSCCRRLRSSDKRKHPYSLRSDPAPGGGVFTRRGGPRRFPPQGMAVSFVGCGRSPSWCPRSFGPNSGGGAKARAWQWRYPYRDWSREDCPIGALHGIAERFIWALMLPSGARGLWARQ